MCKPGRRPPYPPLTQETYQRMYRWVCWNQRMYRWVCWKQRMYRWVCWKQRMYRWVCWNQIMCIAWWNISTHYVVCPLPIRETLVQCMKTSQACPQPILQHRQHPPSTRTMSTTPASTSLAPKTRKCLCSPPSSCVNPRNRKRMSSTMLWNSTAPVMPTGDYSLPLK